MYDPFSNIQPENYTEVHGDFQRFNDSIATAVKLSGRGILHPKDVIHSWRTGPLQVTYRSLVSMLHEKKLKNPVSNLKMNYEKRSFFEVARYSFGQVGQLIYKYESDKSKKQNHKISNLIACQCLHSKEDLFAKDQCNRAVLIRPVKIINKDNTSFGTCIYEKSEAKNDTLLPCYSELLRVDKYVDSYRAPKLLQDSEIADIHYSYKSNLNKGKNWEVRSIRPWEWQCSEEDVEKIKEVPLQNILNQSQIEVNDEEDIEKNGTSERLNQVKRTHLASKIAKGIKTNPLF